MAEDSFPLGRCLCFTTFWTRRTSSVVYSRVLFGSKDKFQSKIMDYLF